MSAPNSPLASSWDSTVAAAAKGPGSVPTSPNREADVASWNAHADLSMSAPKADESTFSAPQQQAEDAKLPESMSSLTISSQEQQADEKRTQEEEHEEDHNQYHVLSMNEGEMVKEAMQRSIAEMSDEDTTFSPLNMGGDGTPTQTTPAQSTPSSPRASE